MPTKMKWGLGLIVPVCTALGFLIGLLGTSARLGAQAGSLEQRVTACEQRDEETFRTLRKMAEDVAYIRGVIARQERR